MSFRPAKSLADQQHRQLQGLKKHIEVPKERVFSEDGWKAFTAAAKSDSEVADSVASIFSKKYANEIRRGQAIVAAAASHQYHILVQAQSGKGQGGRARSAGPKLDKGATSSAKSKGKGKSDGGRTERHAISCVRAQRGAFIDRGRSVRSRPRGWRPCRLALAA